MDINIRRVLGFTQLFVAIGAIPAGLTMILEPNGFTIGMSTDIFKDTPFNDFLIPGIFLLVVNGLHNLLRLF
jgi:hypothetical protein